MVPSKLGGVWKPRIYVTIGKITWSAILDLGSGNSSIPKSLCDQLDLAPIEKCDTGLKLDECSIANAHGRVNNVIVELHMTFVPIDVIIMDMDGKNHSSTILVRHFLRTTGAFTDAKEGNVKFQFPHKKCVEHLFKGRMRDQRIALMAYAPPKNLRY
jgi:hypothetical protein